MPIDFAPAPDAVRVEIDERVATITLNRPTRLNALTFPMLREVRAAFLAVGERDDVAAVVLAGEGRAFCAGLDLAEGLADSAVSDPVEAMLSGVRTGAAVSEAIRGIPQPVIAAVQGHAVGAGFAYAAAADVRIAAPDAVFSAPFLSLGMTVGDFGLSWLLPRLIGHGRAASLVYDGERVGAERAWEWGLISSIHEDPLTAARSLAARISGHSRYAVRATKRLLDAAASASFRDQLDAEASAQAIGALTEAAQEAFAAALAKTKRSAED